MNIIKLIGGDLYQWDTGRKVKIKPRPGETVDLVHFSNGAVVEPVANGDCVIAAIPNVLLREDKKITVYAVMVSADGSATTSRCTFIVNPKTKPDDYVYTETETLTLKSAIKEFERIAEDAEKAVKDAEKAAEEVETVVTKVDELEAVQKSRDEYVRQAFANALKGTASGEVVSITDASPLEHIVKTSVGSKNIVEFPYAQSGTTTLNGVSFTVNDDGTITVNGSPTRATYYHLRDIGVSDYDTFAPIENGTYTFSGCPTGGSASTYKLQFNYFTDENATRKYIDDIGSGKQVVINGTAPRYDLWIVLYEGFTADNLVFKPQVEKGTVVTSYTPYIKELSNVNVLAMGKNWLSTNFIIGGLSGGNGGETTLTTRVRVADYIEVKSNTRYTISGTGDYLIANRMAYDKNKKWLGGWHNGTTPAETAYVRFHLTHKDDAQEFTAEELEQINAMPIQLELGTTATEYTPYKTPVEVGETFTSYEDMVITTDTVGALVNTEYNRDANKAFDALTQAIISLGGNV